MKQLAASFLTSLLLGCLFACNNSGHEQQTSSENKTTVHNNDVLIDFTDSGKGDTTLLFVHGWCINKTYWAPQVDYFSKHYRVVTIDLPGFGASGKNRRNWSVENYAKDVAALIDSLQLKNVVLIGHSMSGAIVLETALTHPAGIAGVVGIDNFKGVGQAITPKEQAEADSFYKAARQNYQRVVPAFASQVLFSSSTDSSVRKRVLDDVTHADTAISLNVLEQNDAYPISTKLEHFKKQLYLVNSDYTPTDTTGFGKLGVHYRLFIIHATGHYPMIEKPQEFNALLAQAVGEMKNDAQ